MARHIRAGSRFVALPLLLVAAFVDWRPIVLRQAPSEWLVVRATDGSSRLRDSAVMELVRRLNDPDTDDATLAVIVNGLWQLHVVPSIALAPNEPLELSMNLWPPAVPLQCTEPRPLDCDFGTLEWRLISVSVDGVPLSLDGRARTQTSPVRWSGTSSQQAFDLPAVERGNGSAPLRTQLDVSYRAPSGKRVGPAVSKVVDDEIRFYRE